MTLTETKKIIAILTTSLPSVKLSTEQTEKLARVWQAMFADIPYATAQTAAQMLLCRHMISVFPTPGAFWDCLLDFYQADEITAIEGWGLVLEAIRRHGRYQEDVGLASLPPRVAQITKRMGWESLCNSELDKVSFDRQQFCRMYESSQSADRQSICLPPSVRQALDHRHAQALTDGCEEAEYKETEW